MILARRHPVAAFLVITYVLGLLLFALPLLAESGIGLLPIELPGAAPFVLLSAIGLAAVAFGVTAVADGREGLRALRRRSFRFFVGPIWYLIALLALPLAALAPAVALQGSEPLTVIGRQPGLMLDWVLALIVAALLINFWEELGWTGFVLHRLQPRIGPIPASVLTTWMQGALHLPLVFIAGGVTDGRVPPEQYPLYLGALFVLPIPVRIVLTWLYNRSGHSVPVVGIYHAALGITTGSTFLPTIAPDIASIWAYAGFAVLGAVVLVATRGRLGYQPSPEDRLVSGRGLLTAEGATR